MSNETNVKPKGSKLKNFAIGILVLFILTALLATCGKDGADSTTDANTTADNKAEQVAAEPAVKVSAKELFAAYQDNEVAADQKYKGKMLEISGVISGIDSGFSDQAIVKLQTANEFMPVSAEGDENFTAAAATLKKGANITLLCKGKGEIAGSPVLDDCVIK